MHLLLRCTNEGTLPTCEETSITPKKDDEVTSEDQCATTCSEESCMIQKDIPGCGGSIDLLCSGGCVNILKVSPCTFDSCQYHVQVRYTCRTKDSTPEPSEEQADIVKKLCKGDKCDTIRPGRELFGDSECPGRNHPVSPMLSFFETIQGSMMSQC